MMHYLERGVKTVDDNGIDTKDQPTIIFFHGISQPIEEFAAFIVSLDIPPTFRILVPEQSGHGKDIERARLNGGGYVHPTNKSMLETTCEFLDVVGCGSNTSAFGISLGGGVLYYVAHARPDIIKRSVLVSPAIASCIDKDLLRGILDGTNNFFCFESRHDVKLLFRDLSTGNDDASRKKKDPVPKFFYESLYRRSQRIAPKGHYKALLLSLISSVGLDSSETQYDTTFEKDNGSKANNLDPFAATSDIDPSAHRLVIWPEKDRIISFEQGKDFFQVKANVDGSFTSKSDHTSFESIPDCGHLFHAKGKIITNIIRAQVREYLIGTDVALSS
jgi:pimeloyl-ACP methyl ester carboxylesterase